MMKRYFAGLTACLLALPFCTACGSFQIAEAPPPEDERPPQSALQETDSAPEDVPEPEDDSELTEDIFFDETDPPLPETESLPETDYNIRLADWSQLQWTQYQCAYFTLNIPAGWQVQWNGNASQLMWSVVSDRNSLIGLTNIDHMYAAKSAQVGNLIGMNLTLENGTVQEYFGKLYADTTDWFTVQNACVPANKEQLQSLRRDKAIWDYQSLYATFSENGTEGEGIYSAVIMETPDLILTGGYNYAIWEINCTFTQFAPMGELINWLPVFNQIAQSFTYTDYYWQEMMNNIGSTSDPVSNLNDPDPVMEAFEERSTADTILQEKRSDMIGEYERVYDNDTGEIYRAYNGFLDDIGSDQTKYSPITDAQYADGYVGWIDK